MQKVFNINLFAVPKFHLYSVNISRKVNKVICADDTIIAITKNIFYFRK